VIGSGLGDDAELVVSRGFRTTAFDISPTAVRGARARSHGSPVDYHVANLLDPPPAWGGAFDLVIESMTVQALPRRCAGRAIAGVQGLRRRRHAGRSASREPTGRRRHGTAVAADSPRGRRLRPERRRMGEIDLVPREDGTEFRRARFDSP
jgi:hypothetical protein